MSPERQQYRIDIEEVAFNAKEITLRNGHHVPILVVEGNQGLVVSQIQEMPETHEERAFLMNFMGEAIASDGRVGPLQQVFLVTEGWMSIAVDGQSPAIQPSFDPNRKEVLIISGLQVPEQRKKLKLFEMVRYQHKQVVALPELLISSEKEETIETPLLDAFAQSYRLGFQIRFN